MVGLELVCVAIVGVYLFAHRREPLIAREVLIVALGALIGEATMIRAYGFYAYAPEWHLKVAAVPLLVPAIWAPVVLSSRRVAQAILPRDTTVLRESFWVGALVTFDAALIEPIAVSVGLWHWNYPGVFSVPVIGIIGWGCYAMAVTWLLKTLTGRLQWLAVVIAPVVSHGLVLALWWLGLRWALREELSWAMSVPAMSAVSVFFTFTVLRTRARLPWRELLPRAAATGFFAVLLTRPTHTERLMLLLWAMVFTPPWMVFCARALRDRGEP